jgi:hypothetical protein
MAGHCAPFQVKVSMMQALIIRASKGIGLETTRQAPVLVN